MSNATKCDRCGACYEYGGMTVGEEYDLCDGCVADFVAWVNAGMHGERVTNQAETLHDTGVGGYRYHIIRDGMMRMVVKGSDLKDTDVVESVDEPDTREKLEADVRRKQREWSQSPCALDTNFHEVIGWLDRQAAITERECMERLHELTDANAELRKYRDEWKGLAEKYRADSIAAQEETERYRAKLGDVLDAIHEAERAAR